MTNQKKYVDKNHNFNKQEVICVCGGAGRGALLQILVLNRECEKVRMGKGGMKAKLAWYLLPSGS